jgi:hypothetical protein
MSKDHYLHPSGKTEPLRFYRSCVGWPDNDVNCDGGLCDMIQAATDITRQTFLRKVHRQDMKDWERELGYSDRNDGGLRMAKDWHVSYHRSVLHGKTVYYFQHSAIEYVFTEEGK